MNEIITDVQLRIFWKILYVGCSKTIIEYPRLA